MMTSSTHTSISISAELEYSRILPFLYHEGPLHLVLEAFLVEGVLVVDEEVRRELVIPVVHGISDGESGTDGQIQTGNGRNRFRPDREHLLSAGQSDKYV